MTQPGWYHGDGDPVGTQRYWDGQQWVGEPTTNAAESSTVYYAAIEQSSLVGAAAIGPESIGITYRTTSTAVPAERIEPPAEPTPAIPASAQLIAIGLSILKAIPLAIMVINTVLIALFGTIGLGIAYNEDLETALTFAVGFSLVVIAVGTALLAAQVLGAARTKPIPLLISALLMTLLDGVLTYGAWVNAHPTDHFFYTGMFVLQGWVLIGAIVGMGKTTP